MKGDKGKEEEDAANTEHAKQTSFNTCNAYRISSQQLVLLGPGDRKHSVFLLHSFPQFFFLVSSRLFKRK